MLEQKQREVNAYKSMMDNKIMKLANKVTELNVQHEIAENEKIALLTSDSETSQKKWEQVSELLRVIAAIDTIENLCSRKDSKTQQTETTLPYAKLSQQQKDFNQFAVCEGIAVKQLEFIGFYMQDFRIIIDDFKTVKPGKANNIEDDSSEDD